MLVYGDAHFSGQLGALRAQLGRLVDRSLAAPRDLDLLRSLLIACGQVEQAAHDALADQLPPPAAAPLVARWHAVTAHAAEAFYVLAYCQPLALPPPVIAAPAALARLRQLLHALQDAPDLAVTVKLPEGFNLHALYPEQYLVAAGQWLAEHAAGREQGAIVVGIRSIGTTLAAVVATVLRAAGWQVQSFTVRPGGHPFARSVTLGDGALNPSALALVVDEGPGISGSSLAATAAALAAAGLPRRNIAFLPGHGNGPGGAGSEEVQSWWRNTRCYVAASAALTFGGLPLCDALAAILPEPVTHWENLSGGTWRQQVYADAGAWPAICTAFERVKYRCTLAGGKRVLFMFMGLAAHAPSLASSAAAAAGLLAQRSRQALAPPVYGATLGFVATEWVEGAPLDTAAPDIAALDMAATLGDYIARVAGPPLAQAELAAATARLCEMFYQNTLEALDEAAAKQTHKLGCAMSPGCARYGDGHLQPHEWIARGDGLRKVDGVGHDCDHTLVGVQPVAWDLAGAIVEWQLDDREIERLLEAFYAAGGEEIAAAELRFYRAACLAFRAGQCSLAAAVHDPYERDRLLAVYARYRDQLGELLTSAHS
jgi:hypothetical protein